MKTIFTILTILALFVSAYSDETTLNITRCEILNDNSDEQAPSKIAVFFNYPEELLGKEIIWACLSGRLAIAPRGADSLFELYFSPLLAEWPQGHYDYRNIETITDSIGVGNYTIRLGARDSFFIDLTDYIRQISSSERLNFGLIGTVDLLGDENIRLPSNYNIFIRNQSRLKVIYK